MKLSLFNYNLPVNLIAQEPASPRDYSRLLVYDRKNRKIEHDRFYNITNYLDKNTVLIFNNTKVFPARLLGNKESGGRAELLLLNEQKAGIWEVMIGAKNPKIGLKLLFKQGLEAIVKEDLPGKTWLIEFNFSGPQFYAILDKIGQVPLPPYISQKEQPSKIKKQYQSVFAKKIGSAAAPTASLHFTKRLLNKLQKNGVKFEYVTLHVGLGTFEPVDTEEIENFKIHKEWVEVSAKTIQNIREAQKQGKKIIAVGTTATRTVEAIFQKKLLPQKDFQGFVDIFIYPGYKFKVIDGIITNFHLPKSSLLMLISALIGQKTALSIYKTAIKLKYRFFSFGDAMLIK